MELSSGAVQNKHTVKPLVSDPLVSDHPAFPTVFSCTDVFYCINMLIATPRERPPRKRDQRPVPKLPATPDERPPIFFV